MMRGVELEVLATKASLPLSLTPQMSLPCGWLYLLGEGEGKEKGEGKGEENIRDTIFSDPKVKKIAVKSL